MIIDDQRSEEQKRTHHMAVIATDKYMSGWGLAENGKSRCAWAARPDDIDKVFAWVESRSEMIYVRVVDLNDYEPPKDTAHFAIYAVESTHPALQ